MDSVAYGRPVRVIVGAGSAALGGIELGSVFPLDEIDVELPSTRCPD
jgi:hypothetical protein